MDVMRLIFRLASATLAVVMFAAMASAYSDEAVGDAEDFVKQVTDRFQRGELTRTDVAQAQHHLLEMKYRAGLISKRSYCRQAMPILETRGKGIEDEARVGQRTTRDLTDHKREFYKFKLLCD
jgi:hypothetical protein